MLSFFRWMASWPLPFLLILPAIYVTLTAVGLTRDDIVENEVGKIWTRQSGKYYKRKEYSDTLDEKYGGSSISSFAGMAFTRTEGGNLFNAENLQSILDRMKKVESTTVEYNGNTITYQDLCSSNNAGRGTTYEFPCLRLSPMDLFQEARWFFDEEPSRATWYSDVLRKLLVAPRVPRFGIMQNTCTSSGAQSSSNACDRVYSLRTDPLFALKEGFSLDYVDPISLFSDIGNLEYSDPCRICIEQGYESTMVFLTESITGTLGFLAQEVQRSAQAGDTDAAALLPKIGAIFAGLDRAAVEEFYFYYVTRGLYAQLGSGSYITNFESFMQQLGSICDLLTGSACPRNVTSLEAQQALLNHADNSFSSVTTAGIPFPFWSNGDGTGFLFGGTNPVGGSGINLGGILLSTSAYLDASNVGTPSWAPRYEGTAMSPADPFFVQLVETDPVYRWFMAGVTPMTAHCGNGDLLGTNSGNPALDGATSVGAAAASTDWCTEYNTPFEVDGEATQQHFAKMWFELLLDSPSFLNVVQGESDPYTWTTGQGCGYDVRGARYSFTNQTESLILENASGYLYYVDEGESVGALDRSFLMGDVVPSIGEYNNENPLERVGTIQNLYLVLSPEGVVKRVKNCNRPGGPIENLSERDAETILEDFKEQFEKAWSEGWNDDEAGDVQFVGFFDDVGSTGSTGRILKEITLSSGTLMIASFVIIALFSVLFLASVDLVESRVLIALVGVGLVILSYFGALGLSILFGIKINITIGWTLPFILIGLGVDDMYIVTLALKRRRGYSTEDFVETMREVFVPVTMTSLVNVCMFAIMNISDIASVYLTAQVAVLAVVFLYLVIILCFPAYCVLDMRRQEAGRMDVLVCIKSKEDIEEREVSKHDTTGLIYQYFYEPMMLKPGTLRLLTHVVICLATLALLGLSASGVNDMELGLGLEDLFPKDEQAGVWAVERTETLASWSIGMDWGDVDYTDPNVQMKMVEQFEGVISTPHVTEVQTKQLWIADLALWTSRLCGANFDRDDPDVKECGRDIEYGPGDFCSGTWKKNSMGLRLKNFEDVQGNCLVSEGGVCRPTAQMHPIDIVELEIDPISEANSSWCPVFEGWSDDKMAYCVRQWMNFTGGGGSLKIEPDTKTPYEACSGEFYNDGEIASPIPISSSPTMFAFDLFTHEDTVDMIEETRKFCDDDTEIKCWLTGIPYDYWEQYIDINQLVNQLAGASIGVGFVVSALFLFVQINFLSDNTASTLQVFGGSIAGAFMIAITTFASVFSVVGLSSLAGVSLTAFSVMSFVLSVGFAVEYSVHIVHRFLTAPASIKTARDRVEYSMNFLFLPTFMSFVSSTIGVSTLAFTEFQFNTIYFFRPLIIVMFVTYFLGCYTLPVVLSLMDFDFLKLGADASHVEGEASVEKPVDDEDD